MDGGGDGWGGDGLSDGPGVVRRSEALISV